MHIMATVISAFNTITHDIGCMPHTANSVIIAPAMIKTADNIPKNSFIAFCLIIVFFLANKDIKVSFNMPLLCE